MEGKKMKEEHVHTTNYQPQITDTKDFGKHKVLKNILNEWYRVIKILTKLKISKHFCKWLKNVQSSQTQTDVKFVNYLRKGTSYTMFTL